MVHDDCYTHTHSLSLSHTHTPSGTGEPQSGPTGVRPQPSTNKKGEGKE
jgi:hypothetical protein